MATKNIKVVEEPGDGPFMEAYIEGEVGDGGEDATVDTLQGATETGRALMKAASAGAARSAIGAGTSSFSGSYNDLSDKPSIPSAYKLPAATTSTLGGVKMASHVASAAGDNVTKAEFEALLDALEAAGVVASA